MRPGQLVFESRLNRPRLFLSTAVLSPLLLPLPTSTSDLYLQTLCLQLPHHIRREAEVRLELRSPVAPAETTLDRQTLAAIVNFPFIRTDQHHIPIVCQCQHLSAQTPDSNLHRACSQTAALNVAPSILRSLEQKRLPDLPLEPTIITKTQP